MTKEEIEHEKLWTEGIVSAVMLSSKGIVSDFISNLEKVGYKIVKAESENERLIKEIEDRVVECILDDIDFGYDLATIKGKIKSGSYVGNSPETFKENERLNQENKEIVRKLIAAETRIVQLKKENERLKAERWILCAKQNIQKRSY